jgi:hypothetical protein
MGMEPWLEHILGLGLNEKSPQWLESEDLLAQARARRFVEAERWYGKAEIILENMDSTESPFAPVAAAPQNTERHSINAQDEFIFDLN